MRRRRSTWHFDVFLSHRDVGVSLPLTMCGWWTSGSVTPSEPYKGAEKKRVRVPHERRRTARVLALFMLRAHVACCQYAHARRH